MPAIRYIALLTGGKLVIKLTAKWEGASGKVDTQ